MKKLKVCAYARVSTGSEEQESSYNNQLSYFSREIAAKGHEFCGIYADKGLTGTKLERTEFEKMLYDAGIDVFKLNSSKNDIRNNRKHTVYELSDRKPKFNEIWIKNTSRFARNTLSFELIDKLRNKGVNIYFLEQNLNTKDVGNDLILKIFQMFDEQDSRDKSLKVISGVKESSKNNIVRTTTTIYGYKYYPMPENRLEIIPDEAEVIKTIFNLSASGYGYRRIINYLTENKIFTRQGKKFAQNTIRSILRNEKYYGGNPILKYDSGVVFNKKSPVAKEEYEIKENDRIPAIISKELFDKCQKIREKNTNRGNKKGVYKGITKFANMLICGNCHSYYTANIDRGKKYYNCRNKKYNGVGACNNSNIYLDKLESLITAEKYNEKIGSLKYDINISLNNWIESVEQKRNIDSKDEIKQLQEQKQQLNNATANLIKQAVIAINDDVRTIINEELEKIVLQTKVIEKEIDKLSNYDRYIDDSIAEIKNIKKQLDNIKLKEKYTEDELLEQIHKIVVNDANDIIIHYNIENKINDIIKKYDTIDNDLFIHTDFFYKMFPEYS